MALRSSSTHLKSMVGLLRGNSNFSTSTTPKMKAFVPTADLVLPQDVKARAKKGDFAPMFMAIGMIGLSTSLGMYIALKELRRGPNVYVKKSRRETIPEVVEPEHVLEESEKFMKRSIFRKLAHINDKAREQVIPNPIIGDISSSQPSTKANKSFTNEQFSHLPAFTSQPSTKANNRQSQNIFSFGSLHYVVALNIPFFLDYVKNLEFKVGCAK
nr:uncharacterized protein LOC113740314 isoform X1 [Coffea arabica]